MYKNQLIITILKKFSNIKNMKMYSLLLYIILFVNEINAFRN